MRRRFLAILAILFGQPIPHEWTDCPVQVIHWQPPFDQHYHFGGGMLGQKWEHLNEWEAIS